MVIKFFMMHALVSFFSGFPPEVATFILAMLPFTEKVSLAIGVAAFHLNGLEAMFIVTIGNMVPIFLILGLAEKFHLWISKNDGFFGKAWVKTVAHAQGKFAKYQKYELWGLFIFMSLPIPINGGISGALIAFILGMPAKKAWPYLFAGVILSNLITLAVTAGMIKIF